MDQKLRKSRDKESIKKAMLKHEEIFKEQVQELHRLYGKQKLLMSNMGDNRIEESEIQLTLGPSIYNTNSSSRQSLSSSNSTGSSQILAPSIKDSSTWEFSRSSQNSIQMNQDRPWLFQALSLKLS